MKSAGRHRRRRRRTGRRVASSQAVRSGSTGGESRGMCAGHEEFICGSQYLVPALLSPYSPGSPLFSSLDIPEAPLAVNISVVDRACTAGFMDRDSGFSNRALGLRV